jgi:hypothetical protein
MSKKRLKWSQTHDSGGRMHERLSLGAWIIFDIFESGQGNYFEECHLPKMPDDAVKSKSVYLHKPNLDKVKAQCEQRAWNWLCKIGLDDSVVHPNGVSMPEPLLHVLADKPRKLGI